jgi:hypothetical protein
MPTPRFGLPYIVQGQAQKEVIHNEALNQLDALIDLYFLDRDLTDPPESPADGDTYLVAASPTGAWAGHAAEIAFCLDAAWRFYSSERGMLAHVADEQRLLIHNGSAWVNLMSVLAFQNLSMLGVNTSADSTNKLAVKSNAVLFAALEAANGGTGDLRFLVNKEAAAKTASLLFEDNWSGRAEIGLLGNDDFAFKVSPDGSIYFAAFSIDRTSRAASCQSRQAYRHGRDQSRHRRPAQRQVHADRRGDQTDLEAPRSVRLRSLHRQRHACRRGAEYPGITFADAPANGQATVYWSAPRGGAAKRNIKVNYQIG